MWICILHYHIQVKYSITINILECEFLKFLFILFVLVAYYYKYIRMWIASIAVLFELGFVLL